MLAFAEMATRKTITVSIFIIILGLMGTYQILEGLIPCKTVIVKNRLESFNVRQLRQIVFDQMMVQVTAPDSLRDWVSGKIGFEIGAPSEIWKLLGVYDHADKMDFIEISVEKVKRSNSSVPESSWSQIRSKGKEFHRDVVDLYGVASNHYEFVCASDVLEHVANPFEALIEWKRILRQGGFLMMILPCKDGTFDHKRSVTRIEHLVEDYKKRISEADLTHVPEILDLHDLTRDSSVKNFEEFENQSRNNSRSRILHQHVFNQELLFYMFQCLNLDVKVQMTWDCHQLIIGQKN